VSKARLKAQLSPRALAKWIVRDSAARHVGTGLGRSCNAVSATRPITQSQNALDPPNEAGAHQVTGPRAQPRPLKTAICWNHNACRRGCHEVRRICSV
jgi:hypothetical protein